MGQNKGIIIDEDYYIFILKWTLLILLNWVKILVRFE